MMNVPMVGFLRLAKLPLGSGRLWLYPLSERASSLNSNALAGLWHCFAGRGLLGTDQCQQPRRGTDQGKL